MAEQKPGRDEVSERLAAIATGLAPLVEQPKVRDELIDAWSTGDGERFRAVLDSIPVPDNFPGGNWCLFVCEAVGVAQHELVNVYRWRKSGAQLTEEEVKKLSMQGLSPLTGSELDRLVERGDVIHSIEYEHPLGGAVSERCKWICFGEEGGIPPTPPVDEPQES
jgi:hypothetical protein